MCLGPSVPVKKALEKPPAPLPCEVRAERHPSMNEGEGSH